VSNNKVCGHKISVDPGKEDFEQLFLITHIILKIEIKKNTDDTLTYIKNGGSCQATFHSSLAIQWYARQ
jgi:hypothetical protein